MDIRSRSRSPSASQHQHGEQYIRSSPSPHSFTGPIPSHQQFNTGAAPSDQQAAAYPSPSYDNTNLSPPALLPFPTSSTSYLDAGTRSASQGSNHSNPILASGDFAGPNFDPAFAQQQNCIVSNEHSPVSPHPPSAGMLNINTTFAPFPHQNAFGGKDQYANPSFMLDPQLQDGMSQQNGSVNPADLMGSLSPNNTHLTSPSNLLTPHSLQSSEPNSPFSITGQHWSPNHSRQASLDPSAAFSINGQQQEWGGMLQGPQFQGHRRAPSEHSDLSSNVATSPYVAHADINFDSFEPNPSPVLNPQAEQQLYQDGLGIERFNISDSVQIDQSPRPSPFVSPRMSPQPIVGRPQDAPSMMLNDPSNTFATNLNPNAFNGSNERFPTLPPEQRLPSNDYGQADQYDVPQISVEPAPLTRQPVMEHNRFPTDLDALSPPERGRKGGRIRAKSDTYISRPLTPSSTQSTLGSNDSSIAARNHSLSPYDVATFSPNGSRSASPSPRSPSQRRSSTSSVPNNRDYILELADPNRPPAPGTEKRIQKHPATFSCHLCPKKFTRAYNLRSHLRTHTDERPFVCTVCTKAFARQHDRKRHEGLHSGEKKFVCRGELGMGANWGCGRRFARADALGRHFRSEAGRICIKPLLDEEAMERARMDDQMLNQQQQHNMAVGGGVMGPAGGMNGGMGMSTGQPFAFPAALLQQFPALQGLQWDQMQAGPDDDELSGHSSFDNGSGAEYYDDDDGASGYVSDNPMGGGYAASPGNWA